MTTDTRTFSPRPSDRWIPWLLFGLPFAVVLAVNSALVYFALSTHSGLVTDQAYERGLAYNRYLAEAEALAGYAGKLTLDRGALVFAFTDPHGARVAGASVTAEIVRPTQSGFDFSVPLVESALGRYEARPSFPRPGLWTVRISATWPTHTFRMTQDIIAP